MSELICAVHLSTSLSPYLWRSINGRSGPCRRYLIILPQFVRKPLDDLRYRERSSVRADVLFPPKRELLVGGGG